MSSFSDNENENNRYIRTDDKYTKHKTELKLFNNGLYYKGT